MSDQTSPAGDSTPAEDPSTTTGETVPETPAPDPAPDFAGEIAQLNARCDAISSSVGSLSSAISNVANRVAALEATAAPTPAAPTSAGDTTPAIEPQAPSAPAEPQADAPADDGAAIVARIDPGDRGPFVQQLGQLLGAAGYENPISQGQPAMFDAGVAAALAAFMEAHNLDSPHDALVTSETWQALETAAAAAGDQPS